MTRKTELSHFSSFNIMSYFIYTDLISSLLDPALDDPGSALIHFSAYNPRRSNSELRWQSVPAFNNKRTPSIPMFVSELRIIRNYFSDLSWDWCISVRTVQLLCCSGMTDSEHTTSGSNEEDLISAVSPNEIKLIRY